jgi:two-component system, NarL family, response regulator NreC
MPLVGAGRPREPRHQPLPTRAPSNCSGWRSTRAGVDRVATPSPSLTRLEARSPHRERLLEVGARAVPRNEIAEQLFLSVRTVETHRAHIQQKLGLSTRAELVRYALDNDLIER